MALFVGGVVAIITRIGGNRNPRRGRRRDRARREGDRHRHRCARPLHRPLRRAAVVPLGMREPLRTDPIPGGPLSPNGGPGRRPCRCRRPCRRDRGRSRHHHVGIPWACHGRARRRGRSRTARRERHARRRVTRPARCGSTDAIASTAWNLRVGRLERRWHIASFVEDSPDVDLIVGDHVEDDVREALQRPGSKIWDRELAGGPQRAAVRTTADSFDAVLDGVEEGERRLYT